MLLLLKITPDKNRQLNLQCDKSMEDVRKMNEVMRLSFVLARATTVNQLNDIFTGDVKVKLGCLGDSVSVMGYQGAVSTDAIANKIGSWVFRYRGI